MNQKTARIIGIALGIIIINIGLYVMNPETHLLGSRDSLGSLIEFGADFYTEIYHMTYSAAHQVQTAYVNICNAIGWLIVAIGLLDVAYFVYKMASDEEKGNIAEVTKLPPAEDIFAKIKAKNSTEQVKRCPYCGDIVKLGRCEMCGKEVK